MKTLAIVALAASTAVAQTLPTTRPVKLNTVGFTADAPKRATVATRDADTFVVRRAGDDRIVLQGMLAPARRTLPSDTDEEVRVAAFDAIREPGRYVIDVDCVGRSAPFDVADDVWDRPFRAAFRGFYLWRCGTAVDATWDGVRFHHDACHLNDAGLERVGGTGARRSVGGWHDAGDYNKYVVNAGFALGILFKTWEQHRAALAPINFELPESGDATPDFLDELRWETDWFLTMQADDGRVYSKVSAPNFSFWGPPDRDVSPRFFAGWSTAATAHFAAAMAMASRHFRPYDAAYADRCLAAARKSYALLVATPNAVEADQKAFSTGTYNVDDKTIRLWAAAELWIATGDVSLLRDFERRAATTHFSEFGPSYGDLQDLAFDTYLSSDSAARDPALVGRLRDEAVARADAIVERADGEAYGRPLGGEKGRFWWGANGQVAASTFALQLADRIRPDPKYRAAELDALAYLFGRNYFARSYVTGLGDRPPTQPHDRRGREPAWPGYLVGGGWPTGASWRDDWKDYRQNEIALNWNAALIYAIAPFVGAAPPATRP